MKAAKKAISFVRMIEGAMGVEHKSDANIQSTPL